LEPEAGSFYQEMIKEKQNVTETANQWDSLWESFEQRVEANSPAWLNSIRRAGNAHFCELGFPTTEDEEWRFTNVRPIAEMTPQAAPSNVRITRAEIAPFLFGKMASRQLVFVDGRYHPELSSPGKNDGVKVLSLAAAIQADESALTQHLARYARYDDNAFAALNTSMIEDGAVITIAAKERVQEPIFLLFVSTGRVEGAMTNPRILVVAHERAEAKVIEKYVTLGDQPHFTNVVTELVLEESARVEHCKIQGESLNAFHIATIQAHQKRNSYLLTHSISVGGAITRNNVIPVLDAEGCECVMNGLYLGRDTQLVDHHTAIHHAKPNCNSHEFYHGILDGKSQGVFNGKIFVRPDAQKTDAKQTNRNLLLSDEATVNTKPQLEIFADDVKCTHGATVGQLEDEHIFYLRARGIGLEMARKMLVHAFASDIVNRITMEEVRAELDEMFFERFERSGSK
jgi:Fe-S cluster assembly protein SufD